MQVLLYVFVGVSCIAVAISLYSAIKLHFMRYFAVRDAEMLQSRAVNIGLEQKEALHGVVLQLDDLTRRVKSLEGKHLRVRRTLKGIRDKATRAARYDVMNELAQVMPDAEQREAWQQLGMR